MTEVYSSEGDILGKGLDSLIGLRRQKLMATRDIVATKKLGEVFGHTGLYGPGGLGKTSWSKAMCYELRYHWFMIEGATVRSRQQILGRLAAASMEATARGKYLFFMVDEVHRMPAECQEALYFPLLERVITETNTKLPPFTMFAATTHPQALLPPFRSRLKNSWSFEQYEQSDIECMVARQLDKYRLKASLDVVEMISKRALGVPRSAYNLTEKVRNQVLYRGGDSQVTVKDCRETFKLEGIDDIGLDLSQVEYLKVLAEAQGNPRGVGMLAGALQRDKEVVEDSIEPVLLSLKFIDRTARGRVLTDRGYMHLATYHRFGEIS